jgi:hypothetical protein
MNLSFRTAMLIYSSLRLRVERRMTVADFQRRVIIADKKNLIKLERWALGGGDAHGRTPVAERLRAAAERPS